MNNQETEQKENNSHRYRNGILGLVCALMATSLIAIPVGLSWSLDKNLRRTAMKLMDRNQNGKIDNEEVNEVYETLRVHHQYQTKDINLLNSLSQREINQYIFVRRGGYSPP